MLSIKSMASGSENYYLHLAREDYYLEGGEPPGVWFGDGARALGIAGQTVESSQLRAMFAGFAPDDEPLVQNAGKPNRQPGWDLTFSAPKSVSTLWSQADEVLRARIADAHWRAVQEALGYIQSEATWTRRGRGGESPERVGLVAATFEHGTSRAQQPQLHTHSLVLNLGVRDDGSWGTVRSRDFYKHKMVAGVIYRVALAHELRHDVGLEPTPIRTWFELAGVSESLAEHFSARRREIEEATGGAKGVSATVLAKVALATRSHKEHRPRSELIPEWHKAGREHGFGPEQAGSMPGTCRSRPLTPDNILVIEPVRLALQELTQRRSFIRACDLVRAVAERMQHGHADHATIQAAVSRELESLVEVGNEHGYSIYATREMLNAEREIAGLAQSMKGLDAMTLDPVEALHPDAGPSERLRALNHLTATPGMLKIVDGVAGSGKSTLLREAKSRWEDAGYTVLGAAVAGKAARELEAASRIKSDTVAKTLHRLDDSGKRRRPAEALRLTDRTVLVIDEASMLGTLQLRDMLRHASQGKSKVVLVGDENQLPAIDAGHPFSQLINALGAARLTDVRRQNEEQHREATLALSEGDILTALSIYQSLDRLELYENEYEALGHLVGTWQDHRTDDLAETLMLASTNKQVDRLNELAQQVRRSRRELSGAGAEIEGTTFYVGDRVRFAENSRSLGIWNGESGTVVSLRRKGLRHFDVTVALDGRDRIDWLGRARAKEVTFSTASYRSIRLGYASTTHAAQGTTVDRAFVLAGSSMASQELSYVQFTRHREELFVAVPRGVIGEDLEAIAEAMAETRDRRQALDFTGSGPGVRPRTRPSAQDPQQHEEQEVSP